MNFLNSGSNRDKTLEKPCKHGLSEEKQTELYL